MLAQKIVFYSDVKFGKMSNRFQIAQVVVARGALDENDRLVHGLSAILTSAEIGNAPALVCHASVLQPQSHVKCRLRRFLRKTDHQLSCAEILILRARRLCGNYVEYGACR